MNLSPANRCPGSDAHPYGNPELLGRTRMYCIHCNRPDIRLKKDGRFYLHSRVG